MPDIWLPIATQHLTNGKHRTYIEGSNVAQVMDGLDKKYPGLKALLCDGNDITPGIAVIIDGEVTNIGMLANLDEKSEVHFLPAIGGG
jgi:molybdopterin synthase sulfur carrier subunit